MTSTHHPKRKAPAHKKKRASASTRHRSPRKSAKSSRGIHRMRWGIVIVVLVMLVVGGTLGWLEHSRVAHEGQKRDQVAKAGPHVEIERVKRAPPVQTLTLEGEARPFQEATMYAKVSGYLKEIRVIEGSVVKKGDVLAVISSPETDQAYVAAVADARNKDRIAGRYRILLKQDLISAQEAEQAIASAQVADATLLSRKQLKDYETLRAPFDGIVTARYVDAGDLIGNSESSKNAQNAVVTLSDTNKLKVDAYVDQKYAPYVHAGQPVETFLPERANERFKGEVARVSGALDRKTRMLFTEIDFENSAQKIVSGSFVQVQLKIPTPEFFMLPVEALVTLNGAPAIAKIGDNHKLEFSQVMIVDNDGTSLLIASGVKENEQVALNVGAELKNGDTVQVPDQKTAEAGGDQPRGGSQSPGTEKSGSQAATESTTNKTASPKEGTASGASSSAGEQQKQDSSK